MVKSPSNHLTQQFLHEPFWPKMSLVSGLWTLPFIPSRILFLLSSLLLLLSHFSCVWLCATPQTETRQAPLSLGFSRQEHWSGLPFPSPMHESEKWKEVAQSCPTPSDPMDCSLPDSAVHGIFQARALEWVAIAFSAFSLYLAKFFRFHEKVLSQLPKLGLNASPVSPKTLCPYPYNTYRSTL